MLVIRLRRGGKKHEAHYRIVVQEQRSKLGGKYIESLGHYHPIMPNKPVKINKERVEYWLASGAQLSVTANNLFVKNGLLSKEQKISKVYSKKKKSAKKGAEKSAKNETAAVAKKNDEETIQEIQDVPEEEMKDKFTDTEKISDTSKKSDTEKTVKVDKVVESPEEKS